MTSAGPLLLSLLVVATACTGSGGDHAPDAAPQARSLSFFQRQACGLPRDQLLTTWNGYHPERSGQIQIVAREPNTVGNWFSHAGPWRYLQDVPLFFYGPGQIPPDPAVDRPVTLADLAPTIARLIDYDFDTPEGEAIPEVRRTAQAPPRLVVVLVWDSVGDNVLAAHPDAWPNLARLRSGGTWFESATLGTSPSITGPVHATIGTGAYPLRHGSVDHWYLEDGAMVESAHQGPRSLLVPSLGDLYDRDRDNVPLVGMVAFNAWHLAMAGHGSYFPGGDRDVGATLDSASKAWGLNKANAEYYDFPEYANDTRPPEQYELDRLDGEPDGLWFGHDVLREEHFLDRLKWTRLQVALIDQVIDREGFGADQVPDLLYVNFKHPDDVGHTWTMNSTEMAAAVRGVDLATGELIEMLDRHVGRGGWVMAVTADHGATPKVQVSGGFQVEESELRADLQATFDRDGDDRDSILLQRPSQVWVDEEELRDNGFTTEQVATYLAGYTKAQNRPAPGGLPAGERDDLVFAAAFPSRIMADLPCLEDR